MLSRLTLIVAHKCNLKCSYCYAKGGDFGAPTKLMSKELSVDIIDHFQYFFSGIQRVHFFGGEPLLAIDTIEHACYYIEERCKREGQKILHFSIVTNGTLIGERFINLAKHFNFSTVISIDGPSLIHDLHRKTKAGAGTHREALKGIKRLKDNGVSFSIECTYTDAHAELGYTPLDVYIYLKSLGAQSIIISEEITSEKESGFNYNRFFNLYKYALREFIENRRSSLDVVENIYDSILNASKSNSKKFCGAGKDIFAVNPLGDVFPCHLFNNQEQFYLGKYYNILGPKNIIPEKSFQECINCPVKDICHLCPAAMYFYNDRRNIRPIPAKCLSLIEYCCLAKYNLFIY